MANKKFPAVKLLALLCILLLNAVCPPLSLFAEPNNTQILQWNADPNVLEYKVEIQNSRGQTIQSFVTDQNKVELSLEQGAYKYKITAYDLLGRESVSTRWIDFEVLIANQPAIVHKQTRESLLEDGKTLELNVSVDDVTADTVAELVNAESGKKIKGSLVLISPAEGGIAGARGAVAGASGAAAAALAGSETFKADKVRFTNVPEGKWMLVITNPSGLSTKSEVFEVKDTIKEKRIAAAKEAEELKKQEAERLKQEAERLKREEAERKEAERIAAEKAEREEAERKIREEEERKLAAKLAAEKAARVEEERRALEEQRKILEEVKRVEQERKLAEQAAREEKIQKLMEEERKEIEKVEQEKQEKLAAQEAEKQAELEAERLAREKEEEAERLVREKEEEAERLALEEEEKLAREEAEAAEKAEAKKRRHEAWLNYDRKFNIDVGAGGFVNLYNDDFFKNYIKDSGFNPTLNAKIGFLPIHNKKGTVRFGTEVSGMVSQFHESNEFYKMDLGFLLLQDNLSLRLGTKSKKIWLQLNAGGGIVLMQEILDYIENSENNREDKKLNFGYIIAGGGLSVIFTPSQLFRIELGADYYNLFIPDMNMGIINPYIAIGIRF